MIGLLCSIIRETGASDSGAAARASLHPSTVSRWKRDCPDFAILLRGAREEFRQAQLDIIQREAQAGKATSWRAAAWLLERIFPEDYAPRARERAQFQERFDAVCAAELEGSEIALPHREEPLQNVHNSASLAPSTAVRHPGTPLQIVQNAMTAGPERRAPVAVAPGVTDVPAPNREGGAAEVRHAGRPLQNVQNAAPR
jgi:hypothetical protein